MKAILIQLPIPRINFGLNTGNVPLAGGCLAQAAATVPGWEIEVMTETQVSYSGDQALIRAIARRQPDLVGFTLFAWNMDRSIFLAEQIKGQTSARIIFGGPQITEETLGDFPDTIDFLAVGQGETIFRQLLADANVWEAAEKSPGPQILREAPGGSDSLLVQGSPYINGFLGLGPGQVMLLETQRGCPYNCGFCYYSKARKKRDIAGDEEVLRGIRWALDNHVSEIYLMDPSFNARPGLNALLDDIARLNQSRQIPIISEIRAESVTQDMAERYARAGFTQFEVGLQSTNPKALAIMNRPTRLDRFANGVRALQNQGIEATIDLIFGLPGDTPQGFMDSVQFILDHGLEEHIQVFPLLVLPGTAFRKDHHELGLEFHTSPPYPVIRTREFTEADMASALDYAEEAFDRAFLPYPDLLISHERPGGNDHYMELDGQQILTKLVLGRPRPMEEIRELAGQISSPFQIFFSGQALDPSYAAQVTAAMSEANPFVPLELVFLNPTALPDTRAILAAANHRRPHFLDLDQQYLFPEPGNRSILFTLVSPDPPPLFQGPMMRQVLSWDHPHLPGLSTLGDLFHLDGILISGRGDSHRHWQDMMADSHEEFLPVCFADTDLQARWIALTEGEKYHLCIDIPLDSY